MSWRSERFSDELLKSESGGIMGGGDRGKGRRERGQCECDGGEKVGLR